MLMFFSSKKCMFCCLAETTLPDAKLSCDKLDGKIPGVLQGKQNN